MSENYPASEYELELCTRDSRRLTGKEPAPQSPSGYSDNIWDPDTPPLQLVTLPKHQCEDQPSTCEEFAQKDTAEDSAHRATSDEIVKSLQHSPTLHMRHGEATSLPSAQAHHRLLGDPSTTRRFAQSDNAEDVNMYPPREEQTETCRSQDQMHSKYAQHSTVETPAIIHDSAPPHNLENIPLSPTPSAQTQVRYTENLSQRIDFSQQHAPETPPVMRPSAPSDNAENIPLPPTPLVQPDTCRRQDQLHRLELHQHDTLEASVIMHNSAASHNAEAIPLPSTPLEQTLVRPSAEKTAPSPDPRDTVKDPPVMRHLSLSDKAEDILLAPTPPARTSPGPDLFQQDAPEYPAVMHNSASADNVENIPVHSTSSKQNQKRQSEDQPLCSKHLQPDTADEPPAPHHFAAFTTDEQSEQPPSRKEDSPCSEHPQHSTTTVFGNGELVEEHSSQQEQPQVCPTRTELSQYSDHLNLQQATTDDPTVLHCSLSPDNDEDIPLLFTPLEQIQMLQNKDQPSLHPELVQRDTLETTEYIKQSPHEEQTDLPSVEEPSEAEESEEPSPSQGFLDEFEIALLSFRPKSAPARFPAWTLVGGAPQPVSLAPEYYLIRPASVPLKLQDQDDALDEEHGDAIGSGTGTPDDFTTAATAQDSPQTIPTDEMPAQPSEGEQEMDEAMNQERPHRQILLGRLQSMAANADGVEATAGVSAAQVESVKSQEGLHLETIPEVLGPSSPDEEAIVTMHVVEVEDSPESVSPQAAVKIIIDSPGLFVFQDVAGTTQAAELDDSHLETTPEATAGGALLETIVEVSELSCHQQCITAMVDSTEAQFLHKKYDDTVQWTETVEARSNIEDNFTEKLEGERDTDNASSTATVLPHLVAAETAESAETHISPETAGKTAQPVPIETTHVEATTTNSLSQSESMVAVKLVQVHCPLQTVAHSEASKVHDTPSSIDKVERELGIMRDADEVSSIETLVAYPVVGETAEVAASECAQETSVTTAQLTQGSMSTPGLGGVAQTEAATLGPLPQPQSTVIAELEQLLTCISHCDSEALSLIDHLLEIRPCIRHRVLDMLSRSLEVNKVPISSLLEIDNTIKAHIDSLHKFIILITSDPPSPEDNDLIQRTIPGFLQWGLFFLPFDGSSSTIAPERLMQLMYDCAAMFRRISQIPKGARKIEKKFAALQLAMRIWFIAERPDDDMITIDDFKCTILGFVLTVMQMEKVNLDSLVQAAGVNVNVLAKRSAARVDAAISASDLVSGEVLVHEILTIISHITTPSNAPFHPGGIVGAFTRSFIQRAKVATTPNDVEITCGQFSYVFHHMEDTMGFPWVREAVENGILEGLLECIPRLKDVNDMYEKTMLRFLVGNLPCYLAYKSVLDVTKKAIENLDWSKAGSAGREWEVAAEWLRKIVEARSVIAGLDPRKYRPYCAKCLERKPKLLRCSRCHHTLYCGTKCQREDHQAGHKLLCGEMIKVYHSHCPDSALRSDLIYIHDFIHIDIMSQHAKILEIAHKTCPSMLSEVLIMVDYTVIPRDLKIMSILQLFELTHPSHPYSHHLPACMKSPFNLSIVKMVDAANANDRTLVIALIELGMHEPAMVVSCIPKLVWADEKVMMVLSEEVKKAVEVLHGDMRKPIHCWYIDLDDVVSLSWFWTGFHCCD
ncbi:hypothetical protein M422DRAFT_274780 [Sphaerobolus stellatus SS14]|uniref:MYND-type domain-containing protein n=1 Tax=Sphaerobolus stellatus (strain SS14) TaxID=990650 RepID=A0A0C9UG85_SPHS4|nr:hypothetical protein M422DRAFT_274780 [Sphaerobolus stellatus SS14]